MEGVWEEPEEICGKGIRTKIISNQGRYKGRDQERDLRRDLRKDLRRNTGRNIQRYRRDLRGIREGFLKNLRGLSRLREEIKHEVQRNVRAMGEILWEEILWEEILWEEILWDRSSGIHQVGEIMWERSFGKRSFGIDHLGEII